MQTPMMTPRSAAAPVESRKRSADSMGSLTSDYERFAKRFNLLRLGTESNNGNGDHQSSSYYINVARSPSPPVAPKAKPVKVTSPTANDDEHMEVDESRDRVFIHNLDDELAEIESDDEDKLIFLPDIEKKFSKIPQHVLTGGKDDDHEGQELVLYSVPKSLTVDEGSDSVRKAILEARQRAREKAAEDARQQDMNCKYEQEGHESTETAHGYGTGYVTSEAPDPDAMDMD